MQYFLLCSKYHTSDTVSYLLIIFEGYTSLMAWYASMNLCASPLLPLKNHWPFPHLHHPSAITTTCHCCRVLACWAGACKYLDERKNGCTRGRRGKRQHQWFPTSCPITWKSLCDLSEIWQEMIDTCTNKGLYIYIFSLNISVIKIS